MTYEGSDGRQYIGVNVSAGASKRRAATSGWWCSRCPEQNANP